MQTRIIIKIVFLTVFFSTGSWWAMWRTKTGPERWPSSIGAPTAHATTPLGVTTPIQPPEDATAISPDGPELLEVRIDGIRNDNGKILAVLFENKEGWPSHPTGTPITAEATIHSGVSILKFPSLPAKTYAIAVIHDEDSNGKMNTGFLGIPVEGFGFSNDAKGFMGPPSFEASRFDKAAGFHRIQLKMKYM